MKTMLILVILLSLFAYSNHISIPHEFRNNDIVCIIPFDSKVVITNRFNIGKHNYYVTRNEQGIVNIPKAASLKPCATEISLIGYSSHKF